MKSRLFQRLLFWVLLVPVALISIVLLVMYIKQDTIVQSHIKSMNATYGGEITVGDIHLAPFESFPYMSLKIDDVKIKESKDQNASVLLDVADIYIGFHLWEVATGNFNIHSLVVEDGKANILIHKDGITNIQKALTTSSEETPESDELMEIDLRKIELRNLDIHQLQEATGMDVETMIYRAKGALSSTDENIRAHIDSEFELNILDNGDTTYLNNKYFEFHTDVEFNTESGILVFQPSGITMAHGDFELEGSFDTKNENTIDLKVKGTKPSFDMFIAFAPEELIPVLERYDNAGQIYFNAVVQGPTKEQSPFFEVNFGAKEAYLENSSVKNRIDSIEFIGHFTNGEQRDITTMEFSLTDVFAKLEKGTFTSDVLVKNFESPEIDMKIDADFELPFVVSFLNLNDLNDVKGGVEMELAFHDIIDLENPEKSLQELNKAYFAELRVEDFAMISEDLPAELKDLDIHLAMNGKEAQLDQFEIVLGNSKLSLNGSLSDLPAVLHHTESPVTAKLNIESEILDIVELSRYSKQDSTGINDRIRDLKMGFSFNALGNAFTEFKYLPNGEFFINDLHADLEQYPHTLHDFHADILINDNDLNIVDFKGFIDDSDFHFNGVIYEYSSWMQQELNGDVSVDITFNSDLLQFEDLFTYQGENNVPEDYRHENLEGLELQLNSTFHYGENKLEGIEVVLDHLDGRMHAHPLRLEDFRGEFAFRDEHFVVKDFHGKMGRTQFNIDMNYYTGDDEETKLRDNRFILRSPFIDFDTLSDYEIKEAKRAEINKEDAVSAHEEAYNIYELPFSDMQFNFDVDRFIYHRLDLQDITAQFRTTHDHYIHLDTVSLDAAGGHISLNGYFNGSNPKEIYLKPNMVLNNVDLDKLFFKFENFGQDAIVSENLHGQLNAYITGNIRMFPDFVADLDRSEVHLDTEVLNGRLENYDPILLLSDYFGNKDLTSIKFDTLQNHMDFKYGEVFIPNMTIESTLGHMDISGSQNMNDSMNYFVRIPWSLVKDATRNKLFGAKADKSEDEIIELDTAKRVRYLNVNILGTFDDYQVKLRKEKKG